MNKIFWITYGWVFIRPIRIFMRKVHSASYGLRLLPKKNKFYGKPEWDWPNLHWWILYRTIGKFGIYLKYNGWRPFCDWTGGYRRTFPWIARAIMKIGQTLSYSVYGGECFHCACEVGCPSNIAEDTTGTFFKVTRYGSDATEDGTNHWFVGDTICPQCGYKDEFSDSSL